MHRYVTPMLALMVIAAAFCSPQVKAAVDCVIGHKYEAVGTQIPVRSEVVWVTIDGTVPSHVDHRWSIGSHGCLGEEIDNAARCARGQERARIELVVDGAVVEPTIFNTWPFIPPTDWRDCPADPEVAWPSRWIFEFPGGYFAPGNHTLEAVWSFWWELECMPCQESIDAVAALGWTITETKMIAPVRRESITLTVLYPP